ncbi:MAG: PAS domain-containing protein, partial [Coprococcus sp.]
MYEISCEFFIISHNTGIEQILKCMPPMEDCVCHFITCSKPEELRGLTIKRDTAVIFDCGISSMEIRDIMEHWQEEASNGNDVPVTAAIIMSGAEEFPVELCRKFDYLWMMGADKDEDSLRYYFGKLVSEMKEKADARKQAICFQTLIDSSEDLIWFKDVDGRHLIVNDEFCQFVKKNKQQIYKQGHCYIWNASEADEKDCLDSDRRIMLGCETQQFEEKVHTNDGDYIIQSYKSPLTEQGDIFGTCGIGKNVTT